METEMKKTLIAMMVALAAASATVTPAQAKGKGFRMAVGVGLLLGCAILRHRNHDHRTVIVPRPAVVQPTPQPIAQQPAGVIRNADDQGRTFDLASRTWFDGRDRCWTGAQAWTFQGGS